ncbi:hypothetical protein ISR92_02785 [Patescibacteria group bacterium]|nr:hypothetical protein [Patescibacteria group bacterium]
MKTKKPELGVVGQPVWHHYHSRKMTVVEERKDFLAISGSAAFIEIFLNPAATSNLFKWFVRWKINQFVVMEVTGQRLFSDQDLKAAFGLSDVSGEHGEWIISRFGADVAEQTKYIRWKEYLNIPCPGTGGDGDPNVSVYLSEEIKWAVKNLLEI